MSNLKAILAFGSIWLLLCTISWADPNISAKDACIGKSLGSTCATQGQDGKCVEVDCCTDSRPNDCETCLQCQRPNPLKRYMKVTKADHRDEVSAERKKQFIRSLKYLPASMKQTKVAEASEKVARPKESMSSSVLPYLGFALIIGLAFFVVRRSKDET